jgi:hypothetical protein
VVPTNGLVWRWSREVPVRAQGWYRDPYSVHEDRYFSDGQPTRLVRDGDLESYDPPPPGPLTAELVEIPETEAGDGRDLRRADDPSAGSVSDYRGAAWATIDSMGVYRQRPN